MASDVVRTKKVHRHMAAYGNLTWQRVGVHACVYTRVGACAHVSAHVCEERDKVSISG